MMKEEDKEYYRLWYEYLQESAYRDYCEWKRDKSWLSPSRKELRENKNYHTIMGLYPFWGDVCAVPFEEWWKNRNKPRSQQIKIPAVEDYRSLLAEDINFCVLNYKAFKDREPTVREFYDYFLSNPRISSPEHLYIRVSIANKTVKELSQEFRDLVRRCKKDPRVKKIEVLRSKPIGPPSNYSKSNIKEIARYLKVFKLKKKFKWAEVLEKIDPEGEIHTGDEFESLRAWKRELQKAKKIIKNVERGEFPGDYL